VFAYSHVSIECILPWLRQGQPVWRKRERERERRGEEGCRGWSLQIETKISSVVEFGLPCSQSSLDPL